MNDTNQRDKSMEANQQKDQEPRTVFIQSALDMQNVQEKIDVLFKVNLDSIINSAISQNRSQLTHQVSKEIKELMDSPKYLEKRQQTIDRVLSTDFSSQFSLKWIGAQEEIYRRRFEATLISLIKEKARSDAIQFFNSNKIEDVEKRVAHIDYKHYDTK